MMGVYWCTRDGSVNSEVLCSPGETELHMCIKHCIQRQVKPSLYSLPLKLEALLGRPPIKTQNLAGDVVADLGEVAVSLVTSQRAFFVLSFLTFFFLFFFLTCLSPVAVSCQSYRSSHPSKLNKSSFEICFCRCYLLKSQSCCQADLQMGWMHLKSGQVRLSQVTVENSQ